MTLSACTSWEGESLDASIQIACALSVVVWRIEQCLCMAQRALCAFMACQNQTWAGHQSGRATFQYSDGIAFCELT